jgi:hypothetical protein
MSPLIPINSGEDDFSSQVFIRKYTEATVLSVQPEIFSAEPA